MIATVDSAVLQAGADPVSPDVGNFADTWRGRIDVRLTRLVEEASEDCCVRLAAAMRYGLLAPGKRVRPLLAIFTALDFERDAERIVDFGCALEMVHCASLMLDDLPCMDDARMRRGQAACHLRFGEATTTLAAIALLNQSYGVLARCRQLPDRVRTELVSRLSQAVGTAGLVSGQSRDLSERAGPIDTEQVRRINHQKTSVLFELAVVGSGMISGFGIQRLGQLQHYARHLGQAFQAADDLLDRGRLALGAGKDAGADISKTGSIHDVGERALRQRLRDETATAGRLLDEMSAGGGLLDGYVRVLFARFG